MKDVKPLRRYDAPSRRARAQATRDRITAVARRLFARDGYAATTIEAIAREAGVAVQTVYATFGSKRAVLLALVETIEVEGGVEDLVAALEVEVKDPDRIARETAAFHRRLFERGADVLSVMMDARMADPDLLAAVEEGEQRRRNGVDLTVGAWVAADGLKPSVDETEARDVLWLFCGTELYLTLVNERGWPPDRYERWFYETISTLLLRKHAKDQTSKARRRKGHKG